MRKLNFDGRLKMAAAAALVAIMVGAGAAHAASPNDAWITSKAKLALMTTEGVSSNAINVDTVGRKVTLHGTVATNEEKQKAEEAVRSIEGVTSVRNLLQVTSQKQSASVARADDQITTDVRAALARQKALDDSTITVASVNKGVVLLSGKADDMTDKLTAVRTARSVPGVRRVSSEIEGPDTIADTRDPRDETYAEPGHKSVTDSARDTAKSAGETVSDTAKSAGHAVKNAAKSTGEVVSDTTKSATGVASDMYTTSMVKMRLLADRETPALDINVDTDDGVVTLFGIVPSANAKAQAAAEAKKVAGVKNVRNELQVVAEAKQENVKASDQEVASDVKQKLRENDLDNVSVDVKNCIVRLTGKVPSRQERIEAMQVARAARGVCAVENDLRFQ
ncbi:MAG TPA: BON domain-containing protein [Candidatus Limnocylindrales bacterium]|nr:BON domain-containing protein [Candidatus Limnocylindrales bacterium]